MIADVNRAVRALNRKFVFTIFAVLTLSMTGTAYSQEAEAEADEATAAEEASEPDRAVEEVIVTGSRLKRDTYTSISPLQVISGQMSREVGLIDPSTILHESTATSGVQVDLTFGAFVVDNGPASSTVDLRGLGASRTLFLVNGRRLSPSGVEGAPTAPDTTLIPATLVQQYEVLLDGASSIYGSDAVAGVVNVILSKDFDGLELEAFSSIPAAGDSDGMQNQISAKWGFNGDRGFFGIGAEYREIERLTLGDREWSDECRKHAEITTDGEIRTTDLWYEEFFGMPTGDCVITALSGYVTELGSPQLGSLFYKPGFSNTTIPNLSDYNAFGVVIDTTNDGLSDINFADYNFNGRTQFLDVIPEIETTSMMAYGEYTFAGERNITPYFEMQYNRRKASSQAFAAQLFPTVNALNPYNPCNPLGAGVDCGLAADALFSDPDFLDDWLPVYGFPPAAYGLTTGAVGPIPVRPVVHVIGDRNDNETDIQQYRTVVGVRGDMPALNRGSLQNWSWDLYLASTETKGDSVWRGVRGDRLDLALGNYSSTGTPCDNDFGVPLASDTAAGCVPVNMFAPSLFANVINNDFATQQERDYLFGTREFDTDYTQTIASFYMGGDVFSLPGGDAMFGLGFEYRNDEIDSIPNATAADGLFFGFSADQGAVGEKYTREFFAEMELPLFANYKGMKELTVNVSTRHTKDEFYGGAWTYAGKLAYRPIDSLLIRGTVGTSYRAPNLRENFLAGQTGFQNVNDPCVIPDDAISVTGEYNPALDDREPEVIQNCINDPGVDPFTFTNNGIQVYSVEVVEGGSLDLAEEKSDSYSAGFVFDAPFWDSFDLVIGATYYDIEVRDEIIEPSVFFILDDCYNDPEFDSPFCSRITRAADSSIDLVDEGFINRDTLKARGVDLNVRFDWPTQMFGRAVDLSGDFAFNRALELSSRIVNAQEGDEVDEFTGEFGYPDWQGRGTIRADVGNWRFTWSTRYVSSVEQDVDEIDDFDNIFTGLADTCIGPENGDVDCRDIGFADNYFTHDASVYYLGDVWTIGLGVRNVTNAAPPFVDGTEIGSFNNRPRGRGYDIFGRTAFVNLVYNWQ
jgi:iron complex outermembrane receptor protein